MYSCNLKGHFARASPTDEHVRLEPSPAAQRTVIGPSMQTRTRRVLALRMRLGGRCTVTPSFRTLFPRARLAATYFERIAFAAVASASTTAAFAINDASFSSTPGLVDDGWASAPLSMASCPARGRPLKGEHRPCHCPHHRHLRSHPHHRRCITMERRSTTQRRPTAT
jgi:hypothetical protein